MTTTGPCLLSSSTILLPTLRLFLFSDPHHVYYLVNFKLNILIFFKVIFPGLKKKQFASKTSSSNFVNYLTKEDCLLSMSFPWQWWPATCSSPTCRPHGWPSRTWCLAPAWRLMSPWVAHRSTEVAPSPLVLIRSTSPQSPRPSASVLLFPLSILRYFFLTAFFVYLWEDSNSNILLT